ncbi:hypothetical protein [Paludibaculum fermentans]|uniref:hypothetical protein n=1 Tax=Paludibaculum fermentans TaxID=1473598 RepID=UPI003EBD15B0
MKLSFPKSWPLAALLIGAAVPGICAPAVAVDLSRAEIVTRSAAGPVAATVLQEEVARRTNLKLALAADRTQGRPAIILSNQAPAALTAGLPPLRAEGYQLITDTTGPQPALWVVGADARSLLYGVGAFLRKADWSQGRLSLESMAISTSPTSPIRGHQLGYRNTANSWDAWTIQQFDQYIRDLTLFGVNSIENIPFQDDRHNPLMKVPRKEMNRAMTEICRKYGLDYWVWTPADIDLKDAVKREALLAKFDEMFADSRVLTGVFVPGGDPGSNPPELVLPFLEDIAKRMAPVHPKAKVWLSLQGFDKEKEEWVYRYIEQKQPAWLGGLVAGPSSPPIARTRQRLPRQYGLRLYPDLTHNKICQYQVPHWDQAYALTLGREAVNPRPAEYAAIHNRYAAASDGFVSYSDGVHDDVNKVLWSALAWDPHQPVRGILREYASLHFSSGLAWGIADAILALERNWQGPLADNGAVEGTLLTWRGLEAKAPQLETNWRWQMCLLRAVYDPYVRRRLLYEAGLETEVNRILAAARPGGSAEAISQSRAILNRAVSEPVSADLKFRIVELCEKLFQSIGLQTSVEKYHASGAERGAVLDFVDAPLNNRWWLEDEFKKVSAMASEPERLARLHALAAWDDPGPGSFYDDIGNEAKSPHVDGDAEQEPESFRAPEPTFWWWDSGKSRARLSWQTTMWPARMVYEGLDPKGTYVVRTGGYGQSLLSIDGLRATPAIDGRQMGEFKEFPVSPESLKDGRLVLTWIIPTDESHLNWRQHSRLAEVWLLKRN